MASKKELFDFQKLEDEFKAAKTADDNILLDEYITAFIDIAGFFDLLGTAFGFVAKAIRADVKTLRAHRAESPEAFATLQSMVAHETAAGLIGPGGKTKTKTKQTKTKSGLEPGCVAAVHLHRVLDFVARFMVRLKDMPDDGYTGVAAADEYKAVLAKYDNWMVQKLAMLATKTLPARGPFLERYIKQTTPVLEEMAPTTIGVMREVFDVAQRLFGDHDLLELP